MPQIPEIARLERLARQRLHLKQKTIAHQIGMSHADYRIALSKGRMPNYSLVAFASLLEMTPEQLQDLGLKIYVPRKDMRSRARLESIKQDVLPLIKAIASCSKVKSITISEFKEAVIFWQSLPRPDQVTSKLLLLAGIVS